jgi:hypothetical protein
MMRDDLQNEADDDNMEEDAIDYDDYKGNI